VQSSSRRLQIRPCWLSYNHWTGMSTTVFRVDQNSCASKDSLYFINIHIFHHASNENKY
jgi:hypothetical protein